MVRGAVRSCWRQRPAETRRPASRPRSRRAAAMRKKFAPAILTTESHDARARMVANASVAIGNLTRIKFRFMITFPTGYARCAVQEAAPDCRVLHQFGERMARPFG